MNTDKLSIDSVKSASSKMETSRNEDSSIGIAATESFNSDGTAVLSVQFDRKSSFLAHSNPKTSTPGRNANKPRTLDVSLASISGRRNEPSVIASSSSMTFGEESDTTALTSTISFEGSAPGSPTQLDTSESSSPATSPPRSEHRALQQKHVIDPSQVPEIRVEAEPDTLYPEDIKVPILGYEVMEERAKFTVYKIQVQKTDQDVWFVFRRYSDFCHLNDQLLAQFPGIRLSLPPKRWFRSNYTREFLDDRLDGLQAFLNNVTSHGEICNSKAVREFFCFDEPPGPHDSLEESRALCETLEESVYNMRKECDEKDREISLLKEELELYRNQVTMLSKCLREVNTGRDGSLLMSPISPELSIAECDMEVSLEPEADQSHGKDDNRSPEASRETSTPIQDLPSPGKRKKRHREVPVIVHKEAEETT